MSFYSSGPGWYVDSQRPDRVRWHDGHAWTDSTAPRGSPALRRPPLPRWWPNLALATAVALAAFLAVNAVDLAFSLWTRATLSGWRANPQTADLGQWDRLDAVDAAIVLFQVVGFVAWLGLFITWLFTAHRCNRLTPGLLKHRSWWAIGGWFIPIACLFMPARVVLDVMRASNGRLYTELVWSWWLTVLLAAAMLRGGSTLEPPEGADMLREIDAAIAMLTGHCWAAALLVVSSGLAMLVVRRGTEQVLESVPLV